MMETIFTPTPLTTFPFQTPFAVGPRPMTTPLFGSSTFAGVGGVSTNAQGLPTAPLPIGVYGSNVPGALPFAPPPALIVSEGAGITAPALLAAVAIRRGQPQGPTNDHEVEDILYDALELIPGAADVEVRCEAGRVTLTGSVQQKRLKRDIGEIAWAIPALSDVQNNITITSRRRARGSGREAEHTASGSARKQG
jgi:BON domain-containing protein